jgi:hypothetical protein
MVDMNAFNQYLRMVSLLLMIGIMGVIFITFIRVLWMLSWLFFGDIGAYLLAGMSLLVFAYNIYGYQAEGTGQSG